MEPPSSSYDKAAGKRLTLHRELQKLDKIQKKKKVEGWITDNEGGQNLMIQETEEENTLRRIQLPPLPFA